MTTIPDSARPRERLGRIEVRETPLLRAAATLDPRRPRTARVELSGELCIASAPKLAELLDSLIASGITTVDVDLAGLDLCTAQGITLLVRSRRRLEAAGGGLRLHHPRRMVARVLEITGTPTVPPEGRRSSGHGTTGGDGR